MRGGHNKKPMAEHIQNGTFRNDRHGEKITDDEKSFVDNRADSLKDRLLFYEAEIKKPEIIADSKKLKLYTDNYTKLMRLFFQTIRMPKTETEKSMLEKALAERNRQENPDGFKE
jgi:hypothetical protein